MTLLLRTLLVLLAALAPAPAYAHSSPVVPAVIPAVVAPSAFTGSVPEPNVRLVALPRGPRPSAPPPGLIDDLGVAFNFGTFGALDTEQLFELGVELRLTRSTLFGDATLRPIVGASLLDDGGNYWYAGVRADIPLEDLGGWNLGLSFAPGVYSAGGVDLGGPVEFRSGIDLGRSVTDHIDASVGLFHLSNGGLYSENGGAESVLFSISTDL